MPKNKKLKIIYEDKYLLIIDKPANLLTISNEYERENTLFHQVYLYLKRKNKNNKVFIVHRLDYETSGLVIFAKSIKVKQILQANWQNVIRKYFAVVLDEVLKEKATLKSYLKETKTNIVYATKNSKNGLLAITNYQRILTNQKYSLLDIEIKTGRKNQIRVQLKDIGHPIFGDKKYGDKKSKAKRMYLHAYYLGFYHPITKQLLHFKLNLPLDFSNVF